MNPEIVLKHEFVEFIPEELEQGTVYVSIRFATASHLCVCGCQNKVVTPIRPTDWTLIFNGKTVSLAPSIGNWNFPCQSHYWIRKNRVRWAPKWTREEIERGRHSDHRTKERYFADDMATTDDGASVTPPAPESDNRKRHWWRFWPK